MPILKPVKDGRYFIKWLHAGFYDVAGQLECHSCERFWSKADIKRLMRKYRTGGFVITDLDVPVGYMVYKMSRKNQELSVLNLVIHVEHRRLGLGTTLVDRLKGKLGLTRYNQIRFDVRDSNLAGHLFLRDFGFTATGVVRDGFEDHYEDHIEKEDAYTFYFKEEGNNVSQDDDCGRLCSGIRSAG